MADKYTKEGYHRFTLRIEEELYKKIKELADHDKRSISKEIEYIIEEHYGNNRKE
ncbi:ribbon-helix-helix protein, CopG family [Limosilactobacillus oris]|uniref:ribbon-helix-helix protein, CopG family n=1 Tax=Limosilactobacillus oris TaxID=1632 RepID=UPI002235ED88|nr:ribbon-helix-helix protein, CopG family [Limosilactobacillus oris]MCW4387037.1 ribbon-helix-helix protein, CopG family [Limosilactobacillus oris]